MTVPALQRLREPGEVDRRELHRALEQAAWDHARGLSGLLPDEPPHHPESALLDPDERRSAALVQLAALRDARAGIEALIEETVSVAGQLDAGGPAIATALGVSPQAVHKRYPHAVPRRPGPRPRTTAAPPPRSSVERSIDELAAVAAALEDRSREPGDHLWQLLMSDTASQLSRIARLLTEDSSPGQLLDRLGRMADVLEEHMTHRVDLAERLRDVVALLDTAPGAGADLAELPAGQPARLDPPPLVSG